VFLSEHYTQCQKLYQVFEVQSFNLDTGLQSFCHSYALPCQ